MNKRNLDNIISEVDQQIVRLKREGIIPNTVFVSGEDFDIIRNYCGRDSVIFQNLCSHNEFMGLEMFRYSGNKVVVAWILED